MVYDYWSVTQTNINLHTKFSPFLKWCLNTGPFNNQAAFNHLNTGQVPTVLCSPQQPFESLTTGLKINLGIKYLH